MPAPWSQGVRVRLLGRIHGQQTVNVFHFATNTVINDSVQRDTLILALLVAFLSCVSEQLVTGVTSDWSCEGVEGIPIAPQPGDPILKTPDAPVVGQLGPASTSFESSLIEVRTGLGGRTHRGRNFFPPAGEAQTGNSTLGATAVEQLTAFVECLAGKFIGAGATENWRMGVLSRKLLANSAANFDTAFAEATNLVVKPLVAVMSSRKVGRGS